MEREAWEYLVEEFILDCNPAIMEPVFKQPVVKKPCGHSDCGRSTSIDDVTLTFGRGELDEHGFWEIPCSICARAYEADHPGVTSWPRGPVVEVDGSGYPT